MINNLNVNCLMKKSLLSILAIAALLTGCTREQNVETSIPHGKRIVTIQADITQTKTTVTDAGLYSWSENETIGVVERDGDEVISFSIEDAEKGLFTGTLTAGKDPVFAVSPAAFVSNAVESGGDIEYDITLDNIDNYVPGTTNAIMVAEYAGTDGDEYKFHFTHAAALVKVRVENVPVGTAKVKLTLDKNITGIWADLTSTNPVLGEDTELGEPSLTLTLKKAVTNPNTSADYYFPVPCNTYTSFQFELLNADGDRIKGMKKTGLNIPLDAADLFLAPTITLEPVEIVKGAEWTYTFTKKEFSSLSSATLTNVESVSKDWTLDGEYTTSGYYGYDGTKGQQFGSGSDPFSSLILTSDSGVDGIEDVVINTSGASSIKATVSVSVAGTTFIIKGSDPAEDSADLTATATEYTFTSPDGKLYAGDIVISYENSSSKAIYLKSISLNPDTRIDPELSYSTDAYNVVASSAFETPVLSAVEGFDGTVTYAIGGEDDPDVASVNAETGAVTIGAKAGTVIVTASFAGNANYKPDSASYTITVGQATLTVTDPTPAKAECADGATVSFTVTSNVEWSASTDDNATISSISPDGAQNPSADPITVTVTFAANTGNERQAIVNVRPTNQTAYSGLNEAVMVTQKEYTEDVYYEKVKSAPSDWSGEYLMICENENKVLSEISTTSTKYGIGADVTISNDLINASGLDDYKITIAKATGNGSGYTLAFTNGYLNWTSGNSLNVNNSESNNTRWTITAGATTGNWIIANVADDNRVIWYNTGSPRFACYTDKTESTSGYAPIQLYKLQKDLYDIIIDGNIENGSVSATPSGSQAEGTNISLTATPAPGYVLDEWYVYKTGDESTKVTVTSNSFTMPAYGVTVSASFVSVPTISVDESAISGVVAAGVSATKDNVYELLNGAADGQVVIDCDGTVVTEATKGSNGAINYTVAPNTGAARDGFITVKYGSEAAHVITVSQVAATYVLTLNATNGTVSASVGGSQVSSGASIAVGAEVTLDNTPNEGYAFDSYDVYKTSDSSTKVNVSSSKFIMPDYAVTASATFAQGQEDTEVTLIIKDYAEANSWVNGTAYTSVTIDSNITATGASGGNNSKYYSSNESWRFYEGDSGTVTITASSGTIKSITFVYANGNSGVLKYGGVNKTSGTTVTINSNSAVFSVGHSSGTKNGNVQITSITVVYN